MTAVYIDVYKRQGYSRKVSEVLQFLKIGEMAAADWMRKLDVYKRQAYQCADIVYRILNGRRLQAVQHGTSKK